MGRKRKKLAATVKKVIKPRVPSGPEKAEITIHEAEDLYKEIRVENTLVDEKGQGVRLKEGASVDVIVEADSDATTKAS